MLNKKIPPRQDLLSPWLQSQGLCMIYSTRGFGKTWVSLEIAYAVASGGQFLSWKSDNPASSDGINWSNSNHGNGQSTTGVAYGNSRYVVVGWQSPAQAGVNGPGSYSTDAINWTNSNHMNGAIREIVYGDNKFVIVGGSGLASYSTDGTSWTTSNHNNGHMWAVAHGNGKFVAVGQYGTATRISVSSNGQTWTSLSNLNLGELWDITFAQVP